MAKPKPEKGESEPPEYESRVLPMQLRLGDRLTDETGEYEVMSRPFATAGGKITNVRVKRVDSDVQMIRTYGAHERISVKRASA